MFRSLKKAFAARPLTIVEGKRCSEYKIVNANLESLLQKEDVKAFAVSGIVQNDNKSEVVVNIAITFARAGKKVLFVNCDKQCIVPAIEIDGFTMLDGVGKKDLISDIQSQKSNFDYIIINLENITENVDSISIAKEVGGLVFVLNKLLSKKKNMSEVLGNYSHVDVKILGTVFMNVH